MSVKEWYQRHSKIKKPLFVLSIIIFIACVVVTIYYSIIYRFAVGDWLFIIWAYFIVFGWVVRFFEVEPTEEEKARNLQECRELLEQFDREHGIVWKQPINPAESLPENDGLN